MAHDRSLAHPVILVTGDFSQEILEHRFLPGSNAESNDSLALHFHLSPKVIRYKTEGGAGMVKKLLTRFAGLTHDGLPFLHKPGQPGVPLLTRVYSLKGDPGANRFWANGLKGYSAEPGAFFSYPSEARGKKIVVIFEEGNHFRQDVNHLPRNIGKDALIIYKMSGLVRENAILNELLTLPGHNPDRLVVILSADQMRQEREVSVSKSVSWEATATDLAYHLMQSPGLSPLFSCAHLIILFGCEGSFYYQNYRGNRLSLIFDPACLEGQYSKDLPGEVNGLEAVFTAVLSDFLFRKDPRLVSLEEGIQKGLHSMREWLKAGYFLKNGDIVFPWEKLTEPGSEWMSPFRMVAVPYPHSLFEPDPYFWTILDQKVAHTRRLVAENIVQTGHDPILAEVPEIRFGKILKAMDRSEIERLSSIWKLIAEYMDHPNPGRPLSLAVFGSPGSGKSFSINQIAEQIDNRRIYKMVFNLSQFREYEELVAAFHKIRNITLSGKMPLVFFDEFDADGLKWLKFFLAPMQDGEFMEKGTIYNLGASIFVFAGGTCATFEQFSAEKAGAEEQLRQLKLPDFVSRLRGFINIKGPNPVDDHYYHDYLRGEQVLWKDENYIIRRAKLIRSLLERIPHACDLFGPGKTLQIDPGVLRALLLIPEYKHGIRSIEAILEMSRLAGKRLFDKAALPPDDQLSLHVDREVFKYLLEKERFLQPADYPRDFIARENEVVRMVARGIHEQYVRHRKVKDQPLRVPEDFSVLEETCFPAYLSNIHAAREIPEKLKSVGVGIREAKRGEGQAKFPIFSLEEEARLARWEHERWFREREWTGSSSSPAWTGKKHPFLEAWEKLPQVIREIDHEAVQSLPFIFEKNGLVMFRMEELEEVDPKFLESMARSVHESYRSSQADPAIPSFDELPPQLRSSNIDQVQHMATKLKRAGFGIRKVVPGEKIRLVSFSEHEVERMAEWEHLRWCWEKWRQGYIFKPGEKDDENRTHPDLVPYGQLPDEKKDLDRDPVREMPNLLAKAGYEVFIAG